MNRFSFFIVAFLVLLFAFPALLWSTPIKYTFSATVTEIYRGDPPDLDSSVNLGSLIVGHLFVYPDNLAPTLRPDLVGYYLIGESFLSLGNYSFGGGGEITINSDGYYVGLGIMDGITFPDALIQITSSTAMNFYLVEPNRSGDLPEQIDPSLYSTLFSMQIRTYPAPGSQFTIHGDQDVLARIISFAQTPIPEPSTLLLLAIGLVGLIGYGWGTKRVR